MDAFSSRKCPFPAALRLPLAGKTFFRAETRASHTSHDAKGRGSILCACVLHVLMETSPVPRRKEVPDARALFPSSKNTAICHAQKARILFLPLMNCAKGLLVGVAPRYTFSPWNLVVRGPCACLGKERDGALGIFFNSLWERESQPRFFF